MVKCISLTTLQDWLYRYSFGNAGLQSSTTDLGDGTLIHFWHPKSHKSNKPTLLLIHGIGANALWQWNEFISPRPGLDSHPVVDRLHSRSVSLGHSQPVSLGHS